MNPAATVAIYLAATLDEIAGCLRLVGSRRDCRPDRLRVFPDADRGGLYRASLRRLKGYLHRRSPAWLWATHGHRTDSRDTLGAIVTITGAVIMLMGPRAAG